MAELDPFVKTDSATPTDDWPAKASEAVVRYVGTVRDKTTGPALTASRYAVYLAAMALIAVVVAILGLVLAVRLLVTVTSYVPSVDQGETWLAYLILGGIYLLVGLFLWRKQEH